MVQKIKVQEWKGKKMNVVGAGLGYRERPEFGCKSSSGNTISSNGGSSLKKPPTENFSSSSSAPTAGPATDRYAARPVEVTTVHR